MRIRVLVLAAVLVLAGCGDDASQDEAPEDEGTTACVVGDQPDGQQRFVVGFEPGSELAGDEQARQELLVEVGRRFCTTLTEVDPPLADGVVVRSDRPLGQGEQTRLRAALERHPDVRYAEPDTLATPDGGATLDGPGAE